MDTKWVLPESRRTCYLITSPFPFSDILDFIIFQGFLVCVHYMLETVRRPFLLSKCQFLVLRRGFFSVGRCGFQSERRLYVLRDQLKVQFRATQKAQINERKAADSKRRLTSWVTIQ
jgi:osomolarity two-component system sensor histidine kinase SLN1